MTAATTSQLHSLFPHRSKEHPMTTDTLSVAVIGAGMAGRTHANAWRQVRTVYGTTGIPPIRLATICDANVALAEQAARDYGYATATGDWHDIADDPDIDIVSIVVANRLHRDIATGLVKAGKHVLCEKPLADTLDNARAMAEVEVEVGASVVTGTGFTFRRNPSIAQIAQLAADGALGALTHFHGRYWCDYGADPATPIAWRYRGPLGSGALGDIGSHLADLAEFVCGPIQSVSGAVLATVIAQRPPEVAAAGGRGVASAAAATETVENDDIALVNVRFTSGAVGSLSVSRVAFGLPNALMFDVLGTGGRASFDLARAGEVHLDDTTAPAGLRGPRQILAGPQFPYFAQGSSMDFAGVGLTQIEQFTYQARAFLDQIIGRDEGLPPVPSFAHGYRAMRIADAITRSAANGGVAVEIA
jgi:predicted dehydrogenase